MATATTLDRGTSASLPLQRILLFFVWLTFFMNAMVIKEPAPCDLFMMAFIVIMPLFNLVRFNIVHGLFLAAWMIVVATGLVVSGTHEEYYVSVQHMVITLYLAVFSVVLAAFVTKNPSRHLEIIWNGYFYGALIAATAAIIGYFELVPGAYDLFTLYDRARGTFKDPNVFAPYLVPAFLYCLHSLLTQKLNRSFIALGLMSLFLVGILMSFSRGAWLLLVFSTTTYVVIFFLTASTQFQRIKTIALTLFSIIALIGVLGIAMQSNKVQDLFDDRMSHAQSYDLGDQGRFSAHKKAANLILEKPLGIGALYFGYFYHHELPHNLYLSMYLTSGWIGGTVFLILIIATLVIGFLILFRRTPWMHNHAIAYSTFIGLAVESYIIDSDHWRQLYILMGVIWGVYAVSINSTENQTDRSKAPNHS